MGIILRLTSGYTANLSPQNTKNGNPEQKSARLLYSIQNGHLLYLLETGTFYFEKDIEKNQNIKLDRLRAVVLQEKFDKITLTE